MDSKNTTWIVGAVIIVLIVIGYAIYAVSSQPSEMATSTPPAATTTREVATSTSATTATTTKTKPGSANSPAKMNASDFQLFVKAGKCTKQAHVSPIQGYKALDFSSEVTIAANQEAWKCSDGEYYTP